MSLRIGLVGYGVGGRYFHAPYISAAQDCELVGVVARSTDNVAAAAAALPGVSVVSDVDDLVTLGVDAVVISTPPATRRDLVLRSLDLGVHVIADKPFAPTAGAGRELAAAAENAGLLLNVFHNRRWDGDIVTARDVITGGALGRITRLDLRCDQDGRDTLEGGSEGGLLRDLGSHVVDQALHLLGPARSVSAHLDTMDLPAGPTDTGFVISIAHGSGAHSHISASKLQRLVSRELRIHGDLGSYRSDFSDVQADAVFAGRRPLDEPGTWGIEVQERWGVLATAEGYESIPAKVGHYSDFYDAFALAVAGRGPEPVPAREGVAVLEVLDAARKSAVEGTTVMLS